VIFNCFYINKTWSFMWNCYLCIVSHSVIHRICRPHLPAFRKHWFVGLIDTMVKLQVWFIHLCHSSFRLRYLVTYTMKFTS
jgi:hypothetical protein